MPASACDKAADESDGIREVMGDDPERQHEADAESYAAGMSEERDREIDSDNRCERAETIDAGYERRRCERDRRRDDERRACERPAPRTAVARADEAAARTPDVLDLPEVLGHENASIMEDERLGLVPDEAAVVGEAAAQICVLASIPVRRPTAGRVQRRRTDREIVRGEVVARARRLAPKSEAQRSAAETCLHDGRAHPFPKGLVVGHEPGSPDARRMRMRVERSRYSVEPAG